MGSNKKLYSVTKQEPDRTYKDIRPTLYDFGLDEVKTEKLEQAYKKHQLEISKKENWNTAITVGITIILLFTWICPFVLIIAIGAFL